MRRFAIYSGTTLVGWSDLEGVDHSMATAYGVLTVADGYARIRDKAISLRGINQSELGLSVRLSTGESLRCDFVNIADHSDEVAVDGIEVSSHGISDPAVHVLFPVS